METFIGTKIVQAEPAYMATAVKPNCKVPDQIMTEEELRGHEGTGWEIADKREGYHVRYADGYQSWSPKEVFEAAYRRTDGMNFGLAIEATKLGRKIARAGWNGKGQYVELGVDFDCCTINGEDGHAHHEDIGSRALVFCGTRGRQVGWLASQPDMLADDWQIVG